MLKFRNKKGTPPSRKDPSSGRSPVFSYYNNRPADIASTRPGRRRWFGKPKTTNVKKHVRHIPTYIALMIIIGSLGYSLVLDTHPKIIIGRTRGDNSLVSSQAVYQQAINSLLTHSLFNRSKLTINTNNIANEIERSFPEIQNATVSLPIIGHHPVIGLDPAQPTLIISGRSGSFVIGEDGHALIKTTDTSAANHLHLPLVQDDSGLVVEQGKAALPKDNVAFITTIISQLSAKKNTVSSLQLPAIVNELRIKVTGKSYYVKFDLSGDARQQVGTYLAVKDKLEASNTTPAEYIDVRINERAYYK